MLQSRDNRNTRMFVVRIVRLVIIILEPVPTRSLSCPGVVADPSPVQAIGPTQPSLPDSPSVRIPEPFCSKRLRINVPFQIGNVERQARRIKLMISSTIVFRFVFYCSDFLDSRPIIELHPDAAFGAAANR